MLDFISNSNQSRILEQLADQDDISLLQNAEYAGAQEETQETPSFCELLSQKKYD
jgi:transcription elongation GreA/GreB family factor